MILINGMRLSRELKLIRKVPQGIYFRQEEKAKSKEFLVTATGGTIAGAAWDIGEAGYYASQGDKVSAILAMAGIVVPEIVEKGVKIGLDAVGPVIKEGVNEITEQISKNLDLKFNSKTAITGTHKDLTSLGLKDSHHIIQNVAVKNQPGYDRNLAPAIQLEGPSTRVGSEHYLATQAQRVNVGGTYGWER